jgi:hypothetical protein
LTSTSWRQIGGSSSPANRSNQSECRPAAWAADAPLFTIDGEQLDWERLQSSNEFAISIVSSTDDAVTFTSADYGTLSVTGFPSEARAAIERVRWFSMIDFSIVLRDGEGGEALAVDFSNGWEELPAFVRRSDGWVELYPSCGAPRAYNALFLARE